MSGHKYAQLEHFIVSQPHEYVVHVEINRPTKLNAFIQPMWLEFGRLFDTLSTDPDVRAIVLSGAGDKAFSAGLDVQAASQSMVAKKGDIARVAVGIRRGASEFQDCISSAELCEKPVICVMHGFTLGLGVDIAACADVRLCARDTKFAVKEVDIGMAADIGSLTRLPKIVGNFGWIKDVALTARTFDAAEALQQGLVSQVHDTKAKAIEAAVSMAAKIASKSPVAVIGTKELLNHARDHTVADSLRYTAVWTGGMMQSDDLTNAMLSGIKKRTPTFEKL